VRGVTYPEARAEGFKPPRLRLPADGTPLSLYFPDARLDPRGPVHYVSTPEAVELRVAERTVFLQATPRASLGGEALLNLTLADGRPLTFVVELVPPGAPADASVQVQLPLDPRRMPRSCEVAVARVQEELELCREAGADRAIEQLAELFAKAPARGAPPVEALSLRLRDKQGRVFVETIDALRLHGQIFLRLHVENRDSGGDWILADVSAVVSAADGTITPLRARWYSGRPALGRGEAMVLVLAFPAPTLRAGEGIELELLPREGPRRVRLGPFRL